MNSINNEAASNRIVSVFPWALLYSLTEKIMARNDALAVLEHVINFRPGEVDNRL
jgi:hypothetical protein